MSSFSPSGTRRSKRPFVLGRLFTGVTQPSTPKFRSGSKDVDNRLCEPHSGKPDTPGLSFSPSIHCNGERGIDFTEAVARKEKLTGIKAIDFVYFSASDVVRHPVVADIITVWLIMVCVFLGFSSIL